MIVLYLKGSEGFIVILEREKGDKERVFHTIDSRPFNETTEKQRPLVECDRLASHYC